MKKDIHKNIIWEKTYYQPLYFQDNKLKGVICIYRFLIKKPTDKFRFLLEPDVIDFEGENQKEFLIKLNVD